MASTVNLGIAVSATGIDQTSAQLAKVSKVVSGVGKNSASAFNSLKREVGDVRQAVGLLGVEASSAGGKFGALAQGMLGAFSAGGPIAIAIAAVAAATKALVNSFEEDMARIQKIVDETVQAEQTNMQAAAEARRERLGTPETLKERAKRIGASADYFAEDQFIREQQQRAARAQDIIRRADVSKTDISGAVRSREESLLAIKIVKDAMAERARVAEEKWAQEQAKLIAENKKNTDALIDAIESGGGGTVVDIP